jgi:hypothetical protein
MQTSRPSQHQPGPGARLARNQIAVQQAVRDRRPAQRLVVVLLTRKDQTDLRLARSEPIPLPLLIQQHAHLLIAKTLVRAQPSRVEGTTNIALATAQRMHPTQQIQGRILLPAVPVEHPPLAGREAHHPIIDPEAHPPTIGLEEQYPTTGLGREARPPATTGPEEHHPIPIDLGREACPPMRVDQVGHHNARAGSPVAVGHRASSVVLPMVAAIAPAHRDMVRHARHRATGPDHIAHLIVARLRSRKSLPDQFRCHHRSS